MRRPLLWVCACLAALAAIRYCLGSPPLWEEPSPPDGSRVSAVGQVYQRETRDSYGKEILVLYLRSVSISEEDPSSQSIQQDTNASYICEIDRESLGTREVPRLGSYVRVRGKLSLYQPATNPGEFDMASYYGALGIRGRIRQGELTETGSSRWPLAEGLQGLRRIFRERLERAFSRREASVMAKMLLGDGSGLDRELRDLYQRNGIVHILSISGLHITMLGMGLYRLLRRGSCPAAAAALAGGGWILLYGGMTGFGISACRAIGMYLIRMLAEAWGRSYDMLTALGVVGAGMVCLHPEYLGHSGFLLSFGSVCGVGLLGPVLCPPKEGYRPGEKGWSAFLKRRGEALGQGLAASLSITLFTLPIQMECFYQVPLYAVFLNLLVLPLMGVVMGVGLAVMLVPGLGWLSVIDHLILSLYEGLCLFFERLPGQFWIAGRPHGWQTAVYYGGILAVILLSKRWKKWGSFLALTGLVIFLGIRGRADLEVDFLDVGQGDCICVQTREGKVFLFDGGSSSRSGVGDEVLIPFLKSQGISRVDGIFLSHPDQDHCSGLLELLEDSQGIGLGALYLPLAGGEAGEELARWTEQIPAGMGEKGLVRYLSRGDTLRLGELVITCLHPKEGFAGDTNEASACFLLEQGNFRLLLTGDVEGEGEQALTEALQARGVEAITVLKVAHHGSRNSTGEAFLEAVEVGQAVISCGTDNSYGHPHRELLERLEREGCRILITARQGCIRMELKDGRLRWRFGP